MNFQFARMQTNLPLSIYGVFLGRREVEAELMLHYGSAYA